MTEKANRLIRAYRRVSMWMVRGDAFIPSHIIETIANIDMAYWRLTRADRRIVNHAGIR